MEIDELEGKKLSEAVARALGMREETAGWWWNGDRSVFIGDDCPLIGEPAERFYNPHRDIAQAWELDGEGWCMWKFGEWKDGRVFAMVFRKHPDEDHEYGGGDVLALETAKMANFPTKAQAYATARCRAFLKAKATE